MALLFATFLLYSVSSVNGFFQCPVCTDRGDPASCTGTIDCDVNFNVCELSIFLKEQNRIEFTCSDRASCSQAETKECSPDKQDKCVFCCNNLGTCREQAYLVFSDFLTTTHRPAVSTVIKETDPPTTTLTTTLGPSMCIQCGKNTPCDLKTVDSLTPQICNVEYPYCFTTIIQDHGNKIVYKGCQEHDFCLAKYQQETMSKPECLTGDYAGQVVNCTFCCTGTACNSPDKPIDSTLLHLQ
ncbi:uncharacterized protein LOC106063773 [Biomphalaria glabrata]|uniref:Uncharacterized protein LOC106063773 n=1 Tax=Biomphalaria glabrata TaxID=6526 RepID=A0A9W3B0I0_BIOGL|nr:uncharacterized protein LOC106063773 [Biomphalaria glabrata]